MFKKLVRHDRRHFLEVDPVRLKRVALRLREEIYRKISPDDDVYSFYDKTIPVLEAAIRGEITDSLDLSVQKFISGNYLHDENEGVLPVQYDRQFNSAVNDFRVTAEALLLEDWELVNIDGVTYGWMDLEEEGDWPDNVKTR